MTDCAPEVPAGAALHSLEEAVRYRDIATEGLDRAINRARQAGWSWTVIAEAVGRKNVDRFAAGCRSRGIY